MMSLGIIIGLVLGVPFGLLLGGLLVANGEDTAAPDLPLGVRLKSTRAPSRLGHRRPDLPPPALLRVGRRILGRLDGPDDWARRGPPSVREIADEKSCTDLPGGVLESMGRLFKRSVRCTYTPPEGSAPRAGAEAPYGAGARESDGGDCGHQRLGIA